MALRRGATGACEPPPRRSTRRGARPASRAAAGTRCGGCRGARDLGAPRGGAARALRPRARGGAADRLGGTHTVAGSDRGRLQSGRVPRSAAPRADAPRASVGRANRAGGGGGAPRSTGRGRQTMSDSLQLGRRGANPVPAPQGFANATRRRDDRRDRRARAGEPGWPVRAAAASSVAPTRLPDRRRRGARRGRHRGRRRGAARRALGSVERSAAGAARRQVQLQRDPVAGRRNGRLVH